MGANPVFLFLILVIRQIGIYTICYNVSEATLKVSSTFSKVVGFQRAKPFGRPPQRVKFPYAKNGEWGEECDSIPRGGEQDRRPLLQSHSKFISKTFRWNVLDISLYEKQRLAPLLGNLSLAEISSFEATASKFTFQMRFIGGAAAPSRISPSCSKQTSLFATQGLCPQDPHQREQAPFGNPYSLR